MDAALVALIKAAAGAGVAVAPHGDTAADATARRVLWARVTSSRIHTDDGPSGVFTATYQLDILAPTVSQAVDLAATLRAALDDYHEPPALGLFVTDESTQAGTPATGQAKAPGRVMMQLSACYRDTP